MSPMLAKLLIACITLELLFLTTASPLNRGYYVYKMNKDNEDRTPSLSPDAINSAVNFVHALDDIIERLKEGPPDDLDDDYKDLTTDNANKL